jgi:hypothetical protein
VTRSVIAALLAIATALPAAAEAQTPPAPAPSDLKPAPPGVESRLWLVAGTAFVSLRGDCQTCEEDFPYRQARSVLANAGYRVNERMDVGGEVFWVPALSEENRVRTTHVNAVAQFRPWASHGFFIKGGAGMAFVRNWIDATGGEPVTSKALSVVIGGGWVFRPARRVGLQLFAAQHAAAIGDLTTADGEVPDVIGNFWSLGVGIVIR